MRSPLVKKTVEWGLSLKTPCVYLCSAFKITYRAQFLIKLCAVLERVVFILLIYRVRQSLSDGCRRDWSEHYIHISRGINPEPVYKLINR